MNKPNLEISGFDSNEEVFLYNNERGQVSLFFPLECYYPDFDGVRNVPTDELMGMYDAFDNASPEQFDDIKKMLNNLEAEVKNYAYFSIVRTLLSELLDGSDPAFVYESFVPEHNLDTYKAAFFDASGLVDLADDLDLVRMAQEGGFFAFREQATEEQLIELQRLQAV